MRQFVIKNVKIVLETKTINLGYLLIRDGVIAEVGEQPVPETLAALQTLDGKGMFLCPGFVDLHTHGGGDHDFMDGEAMIFSVPRARIWRTAQPPSPRRRSPPPTRTFPLF